MCNCIGYYSREDNRLVYRRTYTKQSRINVHFAFPPRDVVDMAGGGEVAMTPVGHGGSGFILKRTKLRGGEALEYNIGCRRYIRRGGEGKRSTKMLRHPLTVSEGNFRL